MSLLPILQEGYGEDYQTQIKLLKSGLTQKGQDQDKAYDFPFIVPVLFAYQVMPNWAEFAVKWLPHVVKKQEDALAIFDSCYKQPHSQKVRHKTLSFINRWSNENGYQFIRPGH